MTIGVPGNLPCVITVGAMTDSYTPKIRADDRIAADHPDFHDGGLYFTMFGTSQAVGCAKRNLDISKDLAGIEHDAGCARRNADGEY
jgi:hypothetical protein